MKKNETFPILRSMATAVAKQFNALDESGVKALLEECESVTQSNCWWLIFKMAEIWEKDAAFRVELAEKEKWEADS